MSGRIFSIVKDYQDHATKPGGFVTVDTTQLAGFEGLEKVRINVPTLSSIHIVTTQTVVTCVAAQIEKIFKIEMPRF